MNPLLVSYSDRMGGAARAAYRLHTALRAEGVDSAMLVRHKISDDPSVLESGNVLSRIRQPIEKRLKRLQRPPDNGFRSLNVLPSRLGDAIDSRSDVVNLHWIGDGALSIADVGKLGGPVVMTLHDMWAFSGAEHYGPENPAARWRTGYRRANKPAGHRGPDLDRWVWERKHRHWRPAHVVCPSRWLARCAGESALMTDWPIRVIPNPLDLDRFAPVDQSMARHALGLPQGRRIVLFGTLDPTDPRKGYDLLLEALDGLDRVEATGVIFGQRQPAKPPRSGIPLRWMGPIAEEATMALLYSAADVMVVPSLQENLVQTGTEAQACGTPVVAFNATGLPDVVESRSTGYLAEPFSAQDLRKGIEWALADEARLRALGREARSRAVRLWDPSVVANQYLAAYRDAIDA